VGSVETIEDASVTTSAEEVSVTIEDSEDIIEESVDIIEESEGISDDIIDESIAEDSIDDIEESIDDMEESMDEEASWAITGSARTAATAVVASRVRIIVGSLCSTLVGQAARRGTWLGSDAARSSFPNVASPLLFPGLRVPEQFAATAHKCVRNPC
jgi:hypothetical protein